MQADHAAWCFKLPDTLSRGHHSVHSKLTSGTILIGVGHQITAKIAKVLGVSIERSLKDLQRDYYAIIFKKQEVSLEDFCRDFYEKKILA